MREWHEIKLAPDEVVKIEAMPVVHPHIHPAVYCVTDLVSLRSVIKALKESDPLFKQLIVPPALWVTLNRMQGWDRSIVWRINDGSYPDHCHMIPFVDDVALMILGSNGVLY